MQHAEPGPEAVSAAAPARARRVALGRGRAWAARALALVPGALVVGVDVLLRRAQLAEYTREALEQYALLAALGATTWGALVVAAWRGRAASRWVPRALLVLLAFFAVGTQLYTFARYGSLLSWRVALMGSSLWPTFAQQLWSQRLLVLLVYGAPVAIAFAIPIAAARLSPPGASWIARIALAVGVCGMGVSVVWGSPTAGWDNGAPPDVLYLAAHGALARSKRSGEDIMTTLPNLPAARSAKPVPAVARHPAGAERDVLMVVTESVRASEVCSAHEDRCPLTRATNAALPRRFGLREMRALDSTTSISIAVMWSGVLPTASRDELLSAPLLWEYAHAAGYATGYWTSQNLLFANAGRWLDGMPVDRFVTGTNLEPYATYQCGADDAAVVDRALSDLRALPEPYFAVVHLSNTHYPYCAYERARPPLAEGEPSPSDAELLITDYRNSIARQDEQIARLVARARASSSRPVAVVFLSDHGEQILERGQVGHTWSLYDEEIHVPMWIDAPAGVLTSAQEDALRAVESSPRTMIDVAPTMLDLLGLDALPELAALRARMPGTSLLRGGSSPDRAWPLTNCTQMVSCATRNWGAIRATTKLIATEDERGGWRCYDVSTDPFELQDLGEASCGDLRVIAEGDGRGAPFSPRR